MFLGRCETRGCEITLTKYCIYWQEHACFQLYNNSSLSLSGYFAMALEAGEL